MESFDQASSASARRDMSRMHQQTLSRSDNRHGNLSLPIGRAVRMKQRAGS